jgi:hypothetical protein
VRASTGTRSPPTRQRAIWCPDRSDRRGAGLAIRYMSAISLYDRSIKLTGGAAAIRQDMSRRPIYLVRGRDRAGNDFEAGQDRPFAVGGAE